MKHYATFDKFNIGFDTTLRKFFITSKTEGHPEIGGFSFAAEAILFAQDRVK